MNEKIQEAICDGILHIGNAELPCAVLKDGTRLLNQAETLEALGRSRRAKGSAGAVDELPPFLAARNLQPFVDEDLRRSTVPVIFRPLHGGGGKDGNRQIGYRAELLPRICEVMLKARDAKVLHANQHRLAVQADILMRGLAHIGIIALVDEATGYQDTRAREALAKILEKFIAKELQPWTRRFPEEFYRQIFRLRGWQYDPTTVKRPSVIGKMTNDLIYDRLAPGVLDELRRKNPVTEKGHRRHRHHQWFTNDIGHPRLREHLHAVVALMRASSTWDQFKRSIERAFPRAGDTIPLELDD